MFQSYQIEGHKSLWKTREEGDKIIIMIKKNPEERFWKYVKKTAGCWFWVGAKTKAGYGTLEIEKRKIYVHRFSYILHYGKIPRGSGHHGICVLHQCDTPPCVNPRHLFLGTHSDNMKDRDNKGRRGKFDRRGEKSSSAKLTWEEVEEIRKLYLTGKYYHKDLAEKFFVSRLNIGNIVRNESWCVK